jgi:hypothetical protein
VYDGTAHLRGLVIMEKNRITIVAALIITAGLLLTLSTLYSPKFLGVSSPGTMADAAYEKSYSVANLLLAIMGSFVMGIGLMLALFRDNKKPVAELKLIPIHFNQATPPSGARSGTENRPGSMAGPVTSPSFESVNDWILVLRLLTGDERLVFRAIVESGGETWQKDLPVRTRMSEAKVLKALDRLVEKGVASMTLYGMTNKVRVNIQP